MRIFHSADGDPMLLEREGVLRVAGSELQRFVEGAEEALVLRTSVEGDPSPYACFLNGLRLSKATTGAASLKISGDNWLELDATKEDLLQLCRQLQNAREGAHSHFRASPVSLIVEADSSWPGFDAEGTK